MKEMSALQRGQQQAYSFGGSGEGKRLTAMQQMPFKGRTRLGVFGWVLPSTVLKTLSIVGAF